MCVYPCAYTYTSTYESLCINTGMYPFVHFPIHSSLPPFLQIVRQVAAGEVVLTQVVLSHSGRMLFVGTSSGGVRAVKTPLTDPGEWTEHQAHSAPIAKVWGGWCVRVRV